MDKNKNTIKVLNSVLDKLSKDEKYILSTEEQNALFELAGLQPEMLQQTVGMDANDFHNILTDAVNGASNRENFMSRLERKVRRGEVTEQLAAGFNTAKDLIGLGMSASQIAQSNRDLKKLVQPGMPKSPILDPAINDAIYKAQQGTFDQSTQGLLASQGIKNQYNADLGLAQNIANGQGATYGALGQVASLRRNAAMSELNPMLDNIRAREQARLDNLLQLRQGQRQQNFDNQMALSNTALNQYNREAMAAGQQGMVGRENLYGSLGNLADDLAVLGGTYASKYYTGNKDIDEYDAKVNSRLSKLNKRRATTPPVNNNYRPNYNPFNQSQYGTV